MGRYKTERIFYPNRWQTTENLVADGYYYAQRKSSETIEIAAHIMDAAHVNDDDELFETGRDLMRAANSPCRFQADYSTVDATDNNNRPSEPIVPEPPNVLWDCVEEDDEEWDDKYDYIFDKKIKPKEIKKILETVRSDKIKERRFYYVAYRILKVLNWILTESSESDYLRWINIHFGCGWENNRSQKKAFHFNLEGTVKKLDDLHPSEWKDDTLYGNLGKHYRSLAISFKNAFSQTIINGDAVDDSDSYVHLKDRPVFLHGARCFYDKWLVPDEACINNGK